MSGKGNAQAICTIYLAGPINARSDQECKEWRETCRKALGKKFCIKDPMDRDYRGRELEPGIAREIVENDKSDIYQSDALLIFFDKPSVGTSMEVLYAYNLGKHIVLVNASKSPLSPWLLYHIKYIYGNLDEAIRHFNEL